jgi:hypothetical protein
MSWQDLPAYPELRFAKSDAGIGPATIVSDQLNEMVEGSIRLLADWCNKARQARKGFGFAGVFALGLEGWGWGLGRATGRARPEMREHDAQPEQDNDDQLIVNVVWYHGGPLSHSGERGLV